MVCMLLTWASLALKDDKRSGDGQAGCVVSVSTGMEKRAALYPKQNSHGCYWPAGGAQTGNPSRHPSHQSVSGSRETLLALVKSTGCQVRQSIPRLAEVNQPHPHPSWIPFSTWYNLTPGDHTTHLRGNM